jgi:3-hydroxybutyrate dehydrogenase
VSAAPNSNAGGRVAIVTGAAGVLGTAIAEALRSDGVCVLGVDLAGGVELEADVATAVGNEMMVAEAVERHGRLDILVLNAGTQHLASLAEFGTDAWDRLQDLMCKGPFLAIRAAWPHLVASGTGRVIAISSTNAVAAEPHKVAYNAAKAGVLGVIRTAALEGGDHGITANAIAPGWMLTPLVEDRLAEYMHVERATREQVIERMLSRMPVKRFIAPAEVAEVVRFLASPASSAVTGALIPVDLGLLAS